MVVCACACSYADVVLVNKVDLVTDDEVEAVEALIRDVNPTARLVRTTQAQVRARWRALVIPTPAQAIDPLSGRPGGHV